MSYRSTQMRFTIGEMDPLMRARTDTEFYYSAAETMTNVICLPEGGFKRRPGLKYLDRLHRQVERETKQAITVPNGGTTANINDDDTSTYSVTTTNIGVINPYIVVHYDLGAAHDIAFVDVVGATLTTLTDNTEFFVQVSNDDAAWTSVGAAIPMSPVESTTRRRVRGSWRYIRFARIGATNLGTDKVSMSEFNVWRETADISAARLFNFKFNIDQSYMLVFTDRNIAVYKDEVFQVDVRANSYVDTFLHNATFTQAVDVALFFQEDIPVHKLTRHGDALWTFEVITWDYIPQYDFTSVITHPAGTLTPTAVDGKTQLTASTAATFAGGDLGQYLEGNGGRARIVKVVSGTVVDVIVDIPFYDVVAIPTGDWTFEKGWEEVWSTTRGYPRCGAFHQERLWIGGSRSRPRTIWASRLGLYYDFDPGALRDSDSIDYDLNEEDAIVNVISHRTLQIFTTGGEATILQAKTQSATPTSTGIVSQTRIGSEPGLPLAIVDGATIYVQRGGKSLGALVFSDTELAYTSSNLSLLSSHLINRPVDFSFRKSTNTEEASYLLLANVDGTLTFGCVLAEQNVKGFTKATTDGHFVNVGVDRTKIYTVVQREIDAVDHKYLEVFDFDYFTDAATQVTAGLPTDTFAGLDYLEGESCRVKADGYVMEDETVTAGSVTLSRDVDTLFEIGLNFDPTVKTLPYSNPEQAGDVVGKKKRIHEAVLRVYDTSDIRVNDNFVSFRDFGAGLLDVPVPRFTGDKKISGIRGWDEFGQITITQADPLPMTVLGITIRVKV